MNPLLQQLAEQFQKGPEALKSFARERGFSEEWLSHIVGANGFNLLLTTEKV